jgi:hypothetical protein
MPFTLEPPRSCAVPKLALSDPMLPVDSATCDIDRINDYLQDLLREGADSSSRFLSGIDLRPSSPLGRATYAEQELLIQLQQRELQHQHELQVERCRWQQQQLLLKAKQQRGLGVVRLRLPNNGGFLVVRRANSASNPLAVIDSMSIAGDHACFWRAVAHEVFGDEHRWQEVALRVQQVMAADAMHYSPLLRAELAELVIANDGGAAVHLSLPDVYGANDEEVIDIYFKHVALRTPVLGWGGEVAAAAIPEALRRPIVILEGQIGSRQSCAAAFPCAAGTTPVARPIVLLLNSAHFVAATAVVQQKPVLHPSPSPEKQQQQQQQQQHHQQMQTDYCYTGMRPASAPLMRNGRPSPTAVAWDHGPVRLRDAGGGAQQQFW